MAAGRPRGRPRSEATHRAILEAAFRVLQSEGYASASIERIAEEAGVAKQTIYRWWPNKAHLFLEVLGDRAEQAAPLPDTGSLAQDLESLLADTFQAVGGALRPLLRALAIELLQDEAFARTMREIFVERRRANIRALVERATARGEVLAEFDAELACDLAFGTMWYRLMFDHAPLDDRAARQLARRIAQSCQASERAAGAR